VDFNNVTVNVLINDLSGNALTLFAGETGGTNVSNPTTANSTTGAIEAWVAAPDYDIVVSGTNVTSYTQKVRQSPQGVYNVKSYGAKSDNSTNDLATVQEAYTAAATAGIGHTVYFPNTGNYIISGSLTVPNNNAVYLAGGGLRSIPTVAQPSKASASSFVLAPNAGSHTVSGTTTITSIPIWPAGSMVTLVFASASCQVTDGSNLNLAGNYTSVVGGTLTIISDGTNWNEVGRKTT
jgi:hypothetical protein